MEALDWPLGRSTVVQPPRACPRLALYTERSAGHHPSEQPDGLGVGLSLMPGTHGVHGHSPRPHEPNRGSTAP
jgi:hypothetical protein